jgi:aspartyl-tRNA(Asn)/glutamyl-tRNA(Gln) amidotransferase subunit C
MSIGIDEVKKVALLARLELGEGDLAGMAAQLSAILDYFDQLKQAPTEGVEPLAHPLNLHNIFREDEPGESLPVDAALANAPDRRDNFFGVPAVRE